MPESSDWTTEFPALRFAGRSIDALFERLAEPFLWDIWIKWIKGVDGVERIGGPDRGAGAKFRVVFCDDDDPSTCEGEIVLSERDAEGLTAAIETRFTPGETSESGSVLVRFDLAARGDEVAYRCGLREEGDPGDAAVPALADRLRSLLRCPPLPGHGFIWAIEASPEAVFEPLLRPHRWSEWIARATEGRVARDRTLPPPLEIPRLAFEPWAASGELDRSGAAMDDPDATISAETPWRLIDPAGEGPAPTILLRAIDPGRSVEFMLVWRDAAALDPEAAELDPDEPRLHIRIHLRPLDEDPSRVDLTVCSQCTPPQTEQRLGILGMLPAWLSPSGCGDATIRAVRIAVVAKLEKLNAPSPLKPLLSISLVVSVVLFIEFGRLVPWISEILWILVPVLLIHELGHFIAMRLLGYRDVGMLFIPLLGAAVRGRHFNEPGWKAAVVALAGPLPGLALGIGGIASCLFVSGPPPRWLLEALGYLFLLNALQLVPIMPLDGGRVVRAVVARRLPWLDFWFLLLGSATLLAGALLMPWRPDWILLVLGVAMALLLPSHFRQDRLTSRLLREGYRPIAGEDDRISWTDLEPIVERIVEMKPSAVNLADPEKVAQMAIEQYERLNHKPPGLVMSALFLLVQFGGILLSLLGLVALRLLAVPHARFTDGGEAYRNSFSPDSTRIVTRYEDGTARVWDAATGNELARIDGDGGALTPVVFNSDGTRLVTSDQDGTARVWNTATGYELMVLKGNRKKVWGFAFSPDGSRIATASSAFMPPY